MTVQIEFTMPAAEDEVYAPGCLDGCVGQKISVRLKIGGTVKGRLVSYDVAETGRSMRVAIELPDEATSIVVPGGAFVRSGARE